MPKLKNLPYSYKISQAEVRDCNGDNIGNVWDVDTGILFAAAPELYDACKQVIAALEDESLNSLPAAIELIKHSLRKVDGIND